MKTQKFWKIQKLWNIQKFENLKKSEKFNFFEIFEEKNDEFNNMTSAMFNAYLISTLKFQFEKLINSII